MSARSSRSRVGRLVPAELLPKAAIRPPFAVVPLAFTEYPLWISMYSGASANWGWSSRLTSAALLFQEARNWPVVFAPKTEVSLAPNRSPPVFTM